MIGGFGAPLLSTSLDLPTPAATSAERFVRRHGARLAGGGGGTRAAATSSGGGRIRIKQLQVRFTGPSSPSTRGTVRTKGEPTLARARPRARALAKGGSRAVPPGFDDLLARSPGQPLPGELADRFGAVLGGQFDGVRVHADAVADEAAQQIEAEAFALGDDVYFARGRYSPHTARGQALLAHELTHVAQQQGGANTIRLSGPIQTKAADAAERVAAKATGTLHLSPATSELTELERERLRAIREILAYEQEHGTWETIQRYNAITGSIPGRNVWVRTSEGGVADLCWMFDVAYAAGATGGTASDVLGGVFGGPGQWVGAALTTSAVGLSYLGGRFAGALYEGYERGWGGFSGYMKGTLNEDNVNGMVLARRLSVSAALGERLTIREVIHPTVLEQIKRLGVRRSATRVAERDMLELQAEKNERAVLQAASTGGGWERLLGGTDLHGGGHGGHHGGGIYRSMLSEVHAERSGSDLVGSIQRRAKAGHEMVAGAGGFGSRIQRKARGGGVLRRSGKGVFGKLFGGSSGAEASVPGKGLIVVAGLTIKWPDSRPVAGAINRSPKPGMELPRMRGSGAVAGAAPAEVTAQLDASQSQGLTRDLEENLSQLLDTDLSGVRIHTDPAAQEATELVGAEAFTLGEDIYFNTGRFAPNSARGLALLVHELTHVAQGQGGAPTLGEGWGAGGISGPVGSPGGLVVAGRDGLELQAEKNEAFVFRSMTSAGPLQGSRPVAGAIPQGDGFSTPSAFGGGGFGGGWGGGATPLSAPTPIGLMPKLKSGYPGALALLAEKDSGGPQLPIPEVRDSSVNELVEMFKGIGNGIRSVADFGAGLIPIFGDIYDLLCAIVGRAIFTWERLDVWDRLLTLAGVIPIPFVSGSLLRRGKSALQWLVSERRVVSILASAMGKAVSFVKRYAKRIKNWFLNSRFAKLGRQGGKMVTKLASSVMSAQDLVGMYRTAQRVINKKYIHYSSAKTANLIKKSGQIGADDAVGTFATPLDPLLGASNSLMGRFARNAMLGGSYDFKLKGSKWKFWDMEVTKKDLSVATEFTGGSFAGKNMGKLEKGGDIKRIFLQMGAIGPQQVEVLATHTMRDQGLPEGLISKFAPVISATLGAGLVAAATKAPEAIGNLMESAVFPFLFDTIEAFTNALNMLSGILFKDRAGGRATRFAERVRGRYVERDTEALLRGDLWADAREERIGEAYAREISTLGSGLPLEWSLRNRVEDAIGGGYLGADLSMVRLHTGARAASLADSMEAEAFALEHRIVLGPGSYAPHTAEGLGTLVHEATHVAQHNRGQLAGRASPGRTQALEGEAYATERRFVARARAEAWGPQPSRDLTGAVQAWRGPTVDAEVRRSPGAERVDIPDTAPKEAVPEALSRALRKEAQTRNQTRDSDPVRRVMDNWRTGGLSRQEFLDECKERLLELMRDEVILDSERRETLSWSPFLPME
jgi:uncharacterized protein DUF4157/putative toxin of predicted polymorphic toxin system